MSNATEQRDSPIVSMKGKNRGEWSEIYAFIYLLTIRFVKDIRDQTLYWVKSTHIKSRKKSKKKIIYTETIYYPNLVSDDKVEVNACKKEKVIFLDGNGNPLSEQTSEAKIHGILTGIARGLPLIWKKIVSGSADDTGSFDVPTLRGISSRRVLSLNIRSLSNKKDDIIVQFEGERESMGYSIKSNAGGNPSLLNASAQTHVIFRTELPDGCNVFDMNDEIIRRGLGVKKLFRRLTSVQFVGIRGRSWAINLLTDGADALNEILKEWYSKEKCSSIKRIVANLAAKNVKKWNIKKWTEFIEDWLYAETYERVAGQVGRVSELASGGMLIIKSNGEMFVRRWHDISDNKRYLFEHAVMDTPDREKHDFGYFYTPNMYPTTTLNRDGVNDIIGRSIKSPDWSSPSEFLTEEQLAEVSGVVIPSVNPSSVVELVPDGKHATSKWGKRPAWRRASPLSADRWAYINVAVGIRLEDKKFVRTITR